MAQTDQQSPVSLNGQIITGDEPVLMAGERGFTLGDGVFDTMLVIDGEMQDMNTHFDRLLRHYAILICPQAPRTYTPPLDAGTLKTRAQALIAAQTTTANRIVLRTSLSNGPGGRGLTAPDPPTPTCLMSMTPAPPPGDTTPVKAIVATYVRRNEHSPLSQIKSLNYGDQLIAHREALARGAGEAVLLNTQGRIACTTVGNIILVENGQWLTPPQSEGAMDGTKRAALLNEGVHEDHITQERLYSAEAVYACNSVRGIQILRMI